jgi:hypothetical protein
MQNITNEASMLLKTQEGGFQFVRKRTPDNLNVACQACRLDLANDTSVDAPAPTRGQIDRVRKT